ncbi:MAG: sigma-70 family RNA polymerase sigma factor [Planctomycetota bacterium]
MAPHPTDERVREQLLVLRAQVGEPEAYGRLVEMHGARLRYYVRRLVRDPDEVEDVVQDTWLAVVRRIATLDDPASFRAWMYRIARNLVTTGLRRRRALRSLDDPDHADGAPAAPEGDDELEVEAFDAQDVHRALERLPLPQRETLALRFVDGLTYDEIAAVVGRSVGTVRSRLHYGKHALHAELTRLRPDRGSRS